MKSFCMCCCWSVHVTAAAGLSVCPSAGMRSQTLQIVKQVEAYVSFLVVHTNWLKYVCPDLTKPEN